MSTLKIETLELFSELSDEELAGINGGASNPGFNDAFFYLFIGNKFDPITP